jgi:hypothetical protein
VKSSAHISLLCLLGLAAGCPDLPDSTVADPTDTIDAEVFVPLEVARVYPSVGDPAGGERVAIYGAGLAPGAVVLFGDAEAEGPLVLDAGQVNATTPSQPPGLVDVTVRLPDGQTHTLEDAYLFRGPLALTGITPAIGPRDGGLEVLVTGEGFDADTRILVGGRLLEDATRESATLIRGKIPSRILSEDATVDVIASNGFEQRTLTAAFTYGTPLALFGLEPISGPAAGGTLVTLRGRGLSMDTVVRFGDVPAENVSLLDAAAPGRAGRPGELLVVRAPPGPHGATHISAANGDERATLEGAFFDVDPTILQTRSPGLWVGHAYPVRGSERGGEVISIAVRGLTATGGLAVRFGEVEASILEVRLGEGAVMVEAPAHAPGEVALTVSRDGTDAAPLRYTYLPHLALTRVEPASGPLSGGTLVLIGEGLDKRATVKVGGKPATYRSGGDTALSLDIGPNVPGRVDIVLVQDGREVMLPGGYDYRSDRAKLWAVSPELGAQAGGRIVRFFGEGFETTRPVPRFGALDGQGRLGTDLVRVDDHVVIARAPDGEPGRVNVDSGGPGFLAMPFEYHDPTQRFGGTAGGPIPEALNVTVMDYLTREGVPDAFVILWDDIDGPYQGLTDARGQLVFSDVHFGPMQMVTASADSYTTASVVEFDARDVTLYLAPLNPSDSGGGGGGGPEPLPDASIGGRVVGFDKYIVTPPGDCEARITEANGPLCAPCASDDECGGDGARCTLLEGQGARCTTACATSDDCPANFMCAGVPGGVQCVPDPGRRTARCQVTMPDVFAPPREALVPTDSDGGFVVEIPPGEYAVVCLGGVEDSVTGAFTPLAMGVRRHVFAQAGTFVGDQDVPLDVPLTRDIRIRLDGAPTGRPETARHNARVYLDLGADGVFLMPQEASGLDENVFELAGFPVTFSESLYDATLTVYGEAVADVPPEEQTGTGSFVVHNQIRELASEAVFELVESEEGTAAAARRAGISEDLLALAWAPGTERLWAVGEAGRIVAWDGTFWALQQAPTRATLRGVWASPSVGDGLPEVFTVGDYGAFLRWDGLRWLPLPLPAELSRASWWGVEGSVVDGAARLWLWGERGVFRWDLEGGLTPVASDLTPGSVLDVAVGHDGVWLVGRGGLIRRFRDGGFERFDALGGDLHSVTVVSDDLAWAVGQGGRILRWDGTVWFPLLPITARDLHAVFASGPDRALIAGDAGEVLRWDGTRWRVDRPIEHADLRGIAETPQGRTFAVGLATLVVGPFMQVGRPTNPNVRGQLSSLELRWNLDPGADASFNWVLLLHPSGFPFWRIVANGRRTTLPLPDLEAAWGLEALWPGEGLMQLVRVYVPNFDMGFWDETILTPYRWRSWSVAGAPLSIPAPQ